MAFSVALFLGETMSELDQKLKLVILGNQEVGKTCLVSRWATGLFDSKVWATVGANHIHKSVAIDGETISLSLWDTAGGERYHALTPLYARGSSVAIIVVDVSNPTTFESVGVWMELLQSACPAAPPALLAINKVDLVADRSTLDNVVSKFDGQFSEIFFVSAKSGESIEQLFERAAQRAAAFSRRTGPATVIRFIETVRPDPRCC
jgi:small GTP-binding protein